MHVEPAPQRFPHAPQLFGSLASTAQVPFGHVTPPVPQTHWPDTHVAPVPQRVPHAPQLFGSLATTAQPPLEHMIAPVPHVHTPDVQTPPAPHDTPQRPQFSGSWATFAHPVEQAIWFAGQMHVPFEQAWQTRPHRPQLLKSLDVFTQVPLQAVRPAEHVMLLLTPVSVRVPPSFPVPGGAPHAVARTNIARPTIENSRLDRFMRDLP